MPLGKKATSSKQDAAKMLLDPVLSKLSDREISRRTGYNHTCVNRLRVALTGEPSRKPLCKLKCGKTAEFNVENVVKASEERSKAAGKSKLVNAVLNLLVAIIEIPE